MPSWIIEQCGVSRAFLRNGAGTAFRERRRRIAGFFDDVCPYRPHSVSVFHSLYTATGEQFQILFQWAHKVHCESLSRPRSHPRRGGTGPGGRKYVGGDLPCFSVGDQYQRNRTRSHTKPTRALIVSMESQHVELDGALMLEIIEVDA
jgi:hypothetical protein